MIVLILSLSVGEVCGYCPPQVAPHSGKAKGRGHIKAKVMSNVTFRSRSGQMTCFWSMTSQKSKPGQRPRSKLCQVTGRVKCQDLGQ